MMVLDDRWDCASMIVGAGRVMGMEVGGESDRMALCGFGGGIYMVFFCSRALWVGIDSYGAWSESFAYLLR